MRRARGGGLNLFETPPREGSNNARLQTISSAKCRGRTDFLDFVRGAGGGKGTGRYTDGYVVRGDGRGTGTDPADSWARRVLPVYSVLRTDRHWQSSDRCCSARWVKQVDPAHRRGRRGN